MTSDTRNEHPAGDEQSPTVRYERLMALFAACRGRDRRARERILASRCAEEPALRAEVEALLAAAEDEHGLFSDTELERGRAGLEGLAHAAASAPIERDWTPERIGSYRVLSRLGAGGMGVVYEAEQDEPRRRVAVKLIHPGHSSDERVRRFRKEAQILGRLNHPGIAQVHESGTFDGGRGPQPFIAMELVEGVDILSHAERRGLDLRARLELLAGVADAVHSANRAGVVHRDLKPDNVLVDREGRPKVLDFGIAFTAETTTLLSTMVTAEGQILGTLCYMAPEQLASGARSITPRADVYALGVIAFQLLSGELPLDPTGLSVTAGMSLVTNEEPRRLSAVRPRVPDEVDTIVGKALEKEPQRRYESAEALAADLRRFLADLPIAARPPSRIYRMRKFARRHRGLVATFVALVLGVLASSALALVASDRTRVAEALEEQVAEHLYFAEMQLAAALTEEPSGAERMRELLAHWTPSAGAPDRRGWEWHLLSRAVPDAEAVLAGNGWVLAAEWHPQRPLLATGELPARVYDAARSEFVARLAMEARPEAVAWSPSGDLLALCAPDEVRVFEVDTWEQLARWSGASAGCGLSWHPDGSHFLIATGAGELLRFDRGEWSARLVRADPTLVGGPGMVAYSPSGEELALFSAGRQSLVVLDAASLERLCTLPAPETGASLTCLAWDPTGALVAVGSEAGHVEVWRRADWSVLRSWRHHAQFLTELSWSPDGRELASASRDSSIEIVDVESARVRQTLRGHRLIAEYVDWDARGERLATGSKDGSLRIWSARARSSVWTSHPEVPSRYAPAAGSWSPDGLHLAIARSDRIELWRMDAGGPRRLERELPGERCFWDRTGERVASHDRQALLVHDWRSGERLARVPLSARFEDRVDASWHPLEPERLAVGNGHRVWLLDLAAEEPVRRALEFDIVVRAVRWSPGGEELLVVGHRQLRLVDRDGRERPLGPRHPDVEMVDAAWSPDGERVAVAFDDLGLRVVSSGDGREIHLLRGHDNQLLCCAWSPDGSRIASGDLNGEVKLWDAVKGRLAATLRSGGEGGAVALAWSPRGDRLAAVTDDCVLRLWEGAPAAPPD